MTNTLFKKIIKIIIIAVVALLLCFGAILAVTFIRYSLSNNDSQTAEKVITGKGCNTSDTIEKYKDVAVNGTQAQYDELIKAIDTTIDPDKTDINCNYIRASYFVQTNNHEALLEAYDAYQTKKSAGGVVNQVFTDLVSETRVKDKATQAKTIKENPTSIMGEG